MTPLHSLSAVLLLIVLVSGCADGGGSSGGSASDADSSGGVSSDADLDADLDADDDAAGSASPATSDQQGPARELPEPVAAAVLGDHLDDWFVWLRLPWDAPFLPRCDVIDGAEDACRRARELAGSGTGQLSILGPEDVDEPSLQLVAQGLAQLVVVLDDPAAAEELSATIREVLTGWGAETSDLDIGAGAWMADHYDTTPGGFAAADPELVTRMIAVHRGRTLVVLTHAERPEDPRLDTQPIAVEIVDRLAAAE